MQLYFLSCCSDPDTPLVIPQILARLTLYTILNGYVSESSAIERLVLNEVMTVTVGCAYVDD